MDECALLSNAPRIFVLSFAKKNAEKTRAELFYQNLDKHKFIQNNAIYMLLSCNEIWELHADKH